MFPYDLFLMTQSLKHISQETWKIITVYKTQIHSKSTTLAYEKGLQN